MSMCEESVNKDVQFHINHEELLPRKHKFFVSLFFAKPRKAIFLFEISSKLLASLCVSVRHTDSKLC